MTDSELESEINSQLSNSLHKRKAYSIQKKLEVVEYANKNSVHSASKIYNIHRASIQTWIKQKNALQKIIESTSGNVAKRLPGAGRHLTFQELDQELANWVREQRNKKIKVSRRIIQNEAERQFNPEKDKENFKASNGWLQKFMIRHDFQLCQPTTVSVALPV